MDLISTTNLIIIPVLSCVGYVLKSSKKISDNYIPFILLTLGSVLGLLNQFEFNGALQGVLCAAVAMGLYDTGHMIKREGDKWKTK